MRPIPENVVNGEYPSGTRTYLLRARCIPGWHKVTVGEKFKFSDENIRLSPVQETSWREWQEWAQQNRTRPPLQSRFRKLFCPVCSVVTRMAPAGCVEVE